MAVYLFPTSPAVNDTYLGPNGVTYVWDGEKWLGIVSTLNPTDYVLKDGNTPQTIANTVYIAGDNNTTGNTNIGGSADVGGDANVSGNTTIGGTTTTNVLIANTAKFSFADANTISSDNIIVRQDIIIYGTLVANSVDIDLDDLNDVDLTGASNGQVLTYSAASNTWVAMTPVDSFTLSAAFNINDGILTQTRNDGATYTVDLDGRYVQTVNGVLPDTAGNVLINLTSTLTGTDAAKPATANAGVIYIVSGDANPDLNGETFIYVVGTGWQQVTPLDTATYDARYINVTGDTMTGSLTLSGDPTANLQAATKQYVDALVANAEVFTSNAVFNLTDGVLTQTRNNGTTYTVDLDGRYLELAAGGTVAGNTVFNGKLQTPTAPTGASDVTNKAYVDALIANSEVTISNFTFAQADGNLVITETNGNTHAVDLDGRYVILPAGSTSGQVLTFDGANWLAANVATTLAGLTDVDVTGAANGDILYWNATTSTWETIAGDFIDNFISTATFNTGDGIVTITRNDGNTITMDIDGRYLELANGGTVAGPTIFTGGLQSNTVPTAADDVTNKAYVDALVANAEVTINGFTFSATDGTLVITETNGNTHAVDLDSRYISAPTPATSGQVLTFNGTGWIAANVATALADLTDVDATGAANGDILYWDATTSKWEVIAGDFIDNFINTAVFNSGDGIVTLTRNDGNTVTFDIDGRYLELANGGTVAGTTIFNSTLQTPTAPTTANDVTNKAYVDALIANSEVYTSNATFDATTGVITQTRTDGTVYTVDIDGRYAQSVNGIVPDIAGNIAVSLTAVQTGDFTSRPLTANAGVVYVVSGDANTQLDGKTYIYEAVSNAWYEVKGFDEAAADARYVNISGDTMAGDLSLFANPTANMHAATKEYVDLLVANSEVYTSNVTFGTADGILTHTRTDGSVYSVDLDGRYLELANGGTVAGPTIFSNTLQTPTAPTAANDVTNKSYVDALVANAEIYTSNATLDSTTGVLTQTRTNGTTYTVDLFTGLDARYVNVTGDTMTGDLNVTGNVVISGTLDVHSTTLLLDELADVDTTGFANNEVLTFNGVTGKWESMPLPAGTADTYVTTATFNMTDGIVTLARNDSVAVTVDLDGRYLELVNGGTVTGNTVFNGNLQTPTVPTSNNDVVNKLYVDSVIANSEVTINSFAFSSTDGNLVITETNGNTHAVDLDSRYVVLPSPATANQVLTFDGANWIAANVAANLADLGDVNVTGVANGDILYYNTATTKWEVIAGDFIDNFITGGTLQANGQLDLARNDGNTVTVDLDGVWLSLVNGGTVTGNTIFNGNLKTLTAPTVADDVTNKAYVDALIANSEVYTSNAVFDITTGIITQTRTDNSTYVVDLDGRYIVEPVATSNGQVLTWNNVANTWEAQTSAAGVTTLALLTDVDVTGVANGDILYYNTATSKWSVIAGDFIDNFVTSGLFAAANGDVTLTRNDGNTIVYNLDGRYLELVDGGTVTGNTIFNGNLQTPTAPTSNTDVANKLYVDSLVANSEVEITNFIFTQADGNLVITESNGNTHAVDLDGRWIVQPTATANGQTLTWNNVAGVWEAQTPASGVTQLSLLTDVNTTGAANGQFLTYDTATSKWVSTTQVENYTANSTFDMTTGIITQTRLDGTTYQVDIDGRYAQSVNGVVPDATGNVILNLTGTSTGTLTARPATPTSDLVYVVSGEANTDLNGETYIYDTATSAWYQITPLDTATYDARYVNVTGDTMTGSLTLNANPTANLHAATKEYVDLLVANSEVFTSNATFGTVDGVLTQTRTDSTIYTVDLDGRWIVQPTATSNGQVLTWNNVTNLWEAQTSAAGVTTLALLTDVDVAGVANGEVLYYNSTTSKWEPKVDKFVASGAIAVANNTALIAMLTYSDATTANVDITHGITNHTDVDTLTVAPANNNVLTWNSTLSQWVPKSVSHVTIADVPPTAPAEGDLWYDSATNFRTYVWSTVAASWLDVAPAAAGGSTIEYIDQLLDVDTTGKVAGQSLLAWDGVNWVAVSVLDASDGTIDDF